MSDEQKLLLKMLLTMLSRMKQCEDSILFDSICVAMGDARPTRTQFDAALRLADGTQWLTSVNSGPFRVTKWSLNDLGRAALAEM